jgi:fructose-bisphosphate aldolase class I
MPRRSTASRAVPAAADAAHPGRRGREEIAMTKELDRIARAMVAPGKGILAADESHPTIAKRFASIGTENTEANRRAYREMLFTTAGAEAYISGVILYDETLRQAGADGTPFVKTLTSRGIVPGIKVDAGAKELAGHRGEKITEGLDGLRGRLAEYHKLGARFTKWRAVITIGDGLPSRACLATNAHALARYAALSQEAGLVPIVEPEVLMDGGHTLERCEAVTQDILVETFHQLALQGVRLEGMVLKPNMVVSGTTCTQQADVETVAEATVRVLKRCVPGAVPGIAFLSGGQADELATAHLSAMNRRGPLPWELTFSYGRALQAPALQAWGGKAAQVAAGQAAYLHRARMNSAARDGSYTDAMEAAAV